MSTNGRRIAAVAVVMVAVGMAPASAAGSRACKLVLDPIGDTKYPYVYAAVLPAQALDIESADVASDGRNLTTVVRVVDVDEPDIAQLGRRWQFHWTVPGAKIGLATKVEMDAAGVVRYMYGTSFGGTNFTFYGYATGAVDAATNSISVKVPVAALNKIKDGGAYRRGTRLTAFRSYGITMATGGALDEAVAPSSTSYTVGQASCVRT